MSQKKSKDYWEKRARENENKVYKQGTELVKELNSSYIRARREIQKSINDLVARYMDKTNLSYAEAVKNLSSSEFKEWRMGLEEYEKEISKTLKNLEEKVDEFKIKTLLVGEYDKNNAILSIHAGAGGTEAQDWAEMLLRMYTRWIADKKYSYKITDYNQDTEGGIKSVSLIVQGINAYGFLKSEKGVHRLVRISPFDQQKRRHTSFASVDVFPEIKDSHNIQIDDKDLKVDTYRASGAGGQHVNMTDSAVRITHIPTGVTVQCQTERSQIANRKYAMDMLIAKLIMIKEEEKREKIEDIQGKYNQIAWGSQIRSYVFQPYTLVKDHRTNCESSQVQDVLDGDLDKFINAYLSHN